jgi:hypothetical protein
MTAAGDERRRRMDHREPTRPIWLSRSLDNLIPWAAIHLTEEQINQIIELNRDPELSIEMSILLGELYRFQDWAQTGLQKIELGRVSGGTLFGLALRNLSLRQAIGTCVPEQAIPGLRPELREALRNDSNGTRPRWTPKTGQSCTPENRPVR